MANTEITPYDLKQQVFARDNHTCQYCGATDKRIIAEHVIPQLQDGHCAAYNLVAACASCNAKKRGVVWLPRNIDVLEQLWPEWGQFIRARAAEDVAVQERHARSKPVSYRLDPAVVKAIRMASITQGREVGEIVTEALTQWLAQNGG